MSGDKGRSLYWRLAQQARPYWLHLSGVFSVESSLVALRPAQPAAIENRGGHRAGPSPVAVVAGDLAAPRPDPVTAGPLALAVGLLVGVAVLTQFRDFANALLTAYTGEKLLRSFRAQLFRHVQRLSFSYHDTKGTADSTYRIQYDATSVQRIIVDGGRPFITSAVTFLSMIYVTTRIKLATGNCCPGGVSGHFSGIADLPAPDASPVA